MAAWPEELPQEFEVGGFSVTPPNYFLRTDMDAGLPKRRRRFTVGISQIEGKMMMNLDQIQYLRDFYALDLHGGVDLFDFPRPGYCAGTISVSFKELPKLQHLGAEVFQVNISLETLEDYLAGETS